MIVVASTGDQFADFSPYVPSIKDAGQVAFQATLINGSSAVFVDDELRAQGEIISHPDIDERGRVCFYGTIGSRKGVWLDDQPLHLSEGIGPLGPTMNDYGAVAFRSTGFPPVRKSERIYVAGTDGVRIVAEVGGDITGFQGLPVVSSRGEVLYRADLHEGAAIFLEDREIVRTGAEFTELGRFPHMNDSGEIVFAGVRNGASGIYKLANGETETVIDTATAPFESFRGALICEAGQVVYYATPAGGQLGIYRGSKRLMSLGDEAYGSTVTDLALNPVSINRHGQLAIRIKLADDRQMILRA